MPNTFDAVPSSSQERSTAFLQVEQPADRLESIMDEAQLHRGSLREQDGYTIPFREGGQVRIRVREDEGSPGLEFEVGAPTEDRRGHIERTITEQVQQQLGGPELKWESTAR